MSNTLTDQYQLVRITTVDAGFWQNLLGKPINYNDGFCRELFRDGRHIGSIRSDADTASAKRGDTILSVNMGIVTVPFTDKLPTRDGYQLGYDGTVRLQVGDPRLFATCYQQAIDPLQKAIDSIRGALTREIARTQHDDATGEYLRHIVEYYSGQHGTFPTPGGLREVTIIAEYGMLILDAQTLIPRPDPQRKVDKEEDERVKRETERLRKDEQIELARLSQQWVVGEEQRKHDIRTRENQLDDDSARRDHARVQQEQDVLHAAAVKLRIESAQEQAQQDRDLLRRLRDDEWPRDRILREYPELAYLFERRDILTGQLMEPESQPRIAGPATAVTLQPGTTSPAEVYGVSSESRPDDLSTISHLGIRVSRHKFSDEEMGWSGAKSGLAYFIEDVIPDWKGEQKLKKGDFLFEIADRPVPELPELARLLNELNAGDRPVKITYLRGTAVLVAYADIPSTTP